MRGGGKGKTCVVRATSCASWTMLRRASYPPQLRPMMPIPSMSVRTRSRAVHIMRAGGCSKRCEGHLLNLRKGSISIPSLTACTLTSKQGKLTISSACLARLPNSHSLVLAGWAFYLNHESCISLPLDQEGRKAASGTDMIKLVFGGNLS